MPKLICYKEMPVWNKETLPAAFQEKHNTQPGTWAKLTIFSGSLKFAMLNDDGDIVDEFVFSQESQPPFIEPQAWHKIVSCSDDLRCQLAFYCLPEDYCSKKYGLTKTHSEVIAATEDMAACKALDLGCGSGRNSLYLNLRGFDVTAYDKNVLGIGSINDIIQSENLTGISAEVFDINNQRLTESYDFILSTVVLMFLDSDKIPDIIGNIQEKTHLGGYNLIVSAMSTSDYPCTMPFSFTFKEDELKNYYAGWEIIKYNEDVGQLHKTDANGQRIKLRFATLLAKKIS